MAVHCERLAGQDVLARIEHLATIYRAAFAAPPWNEDERAAAAFVDRLATDVLRPGFGAVLASIEGRPVGFGTAWRTPAPFPSGRAYDLVRAELADEVEAVLVGALEVDELAVIPQARGQGVAARVLDLLCSGAPDCWLLTAPGAADAIRFYERRGWRRRTRPAADIVVFTRHSGSPVA
jgi:GNAT superfamily N-acetyltransferase